MTDHILDRPIWHTLATRHARFAVGTERALRFLSEIGPFASPKDDSPESLSALTEIIPPEGIMIIQVDEIKAPPGAVAAERGFGVQMVAEGFAAGSLDTSGLERLGDADAEEMVALAALTRPGPFAGGTHRLGDFWGIRHEGRLVAMAGERFKLPGLTEVSGVCTHPDFRGRGYAARLMTHVARHIVERGETPFLHAYADNTSAIKLYERLGFHLRTYVNVAKFVPATNSDI